MKYLKIQNKGELDIRLIALMGGTTKADDPTKIGQFGTGLKYAISFLVRNDIGFYLFVGNQEIVFSTKEENISGKDFKEIYCDGKSMNITTHYGYQWQAWEALREIYCNATDEGDENKTIVTKAKIKGERNQTIFYIEMVPAIAEVLDKWNDYFLTSTPLFENDAVAIYANTGGNLKLYKNGVLIQNSEYYKSLFIYDLKTANLNELRQYQGYLSSDIGKALLGANKEVARALITAIKDEKQKETYECKLDWSYLSYNAKHVKSIFSIGYLYLHPQSSKGGEKSVIVNETLFNLLTTCGLLTERIKQSSGGWYGGSRLGHKQTDKIYYKEILNPDLQKRLQKIAIKYGSDMKYSIAVPKETDFDFVVNKELVIFNSALENLSDADLEATVLISILHTQESNIYKAFKRLIKYATGNRNFRKMLFGRNIGDKLKPTYQPPISEKNKLQAQPFDVSEDDLLPF